MISIFKERKFDYEKSRYNVYVGYSSLNAHLPRLFKFILRESAEDNSKPARGQPIKTM